MKKSRYGEEQIIGIFEGERSWDEDGGFVPGSTGSARRRSMAGAEIGGMDVSEAQRLKAMEDENAV